MFAQMCDKSYKHTIMETFGVNVTWRWSLVGSHEQRRYLWSMSKECDKWTCDSIIKIQRKLQRLHRILSGHKNLSWRILKEIPFIDEWNGRKMKKPKHEASVELCLNCKALRLPKRLTALARWYLGEFQLAFSKKLRKVKYKRQIIGKVVSFICSTRKLNLFRSKHNIFSKHLIKRFQQLPTTMSNFLFA